jgi:hypothetical protein
VQAEKPRPIARLEHPIHGQNMQRCRDDFKSDERYDQAAREGFQVLPQG